MNGKAQTLSKVEAVNAAIGKHGTVMPDLPIKKKFFFNFYLFFSGSF